MSRLLEDPELGSVDDLVLKSLFTTASLPVFCDRTCSWDQEVDLHLEAPACAKGKRCNLGEGAGQGDLLPTPLLKPSVCFACHDIVSGTLLVGSALGLQRLPWRPPRHAGCQGRPKWLSQHEGP